MNMMDDYEELRFQAFVIHGANIENYVAVTPYAATDGKDFEDACSSAIRYVSHELEKLIKQGATQEDAIEHLPTIEGIANSYLKGVSTSILKVEILPDRRISFKVGESESRVGVAYRGIRKQEPTEGLPAIIMDVYEAELELMQ